jgi:hypothetical protein
VEQIGFVQATRLLARLLDRPSAPERLAEAVVPLPAALRMDVFRRILVNNDRTRSRVAVKETVFNAWLALFGGTELVLEEFLGDHWSRLAFDHLVTTDRPLQAVTKLTLASREVNQVFIIIIVLVIIVIL